MIHPPKQDESQNHACGNPPRFRFRAGRFNGKFFSVRSFLGMIRSYLRMFRDRGARFTLNHFFQDHLFDLVNGTDTYQMINSADYKESLVNLEHGFSYMSSWKSVVRKSTWKALDLLPVPSGEVTFVDIGSGKGKVLSIWEGMFRGTERFIGIEYSQHLAEICEQNLKIIGATRTGVIVSDILEIDVAELGKHPLIYMFNPFDDYLMDKFLKKIRCVDCCVIYNNYVHHDLLLKNGFRQVYENESESLNARYAIYRPVSI